MDLKEGYGYSEDKELVGKSQPEGCQWLYVQVKAGHQWCPPEAHLGTGIL